MDDSNSELEELKIDRQREAMRHRGGDSGGGRITKGDPGVTRVRDWVLGIIGALVVTSLCAVANNLWQVNLTIRDVLAENRVTKDTLADHEARLRTGERFQSTWEGRNLRGGPESENDPKERSRGN